MDERIYYHGSDGHIKQLGDQELQHYKYIKKIGNRYFYTPEALRAYYADQKKVATVEYGKDRMIDKANQAKRGATIRKDYAIGNDSREAYERNKKINKAIYDAQGQYRKVKKNVKPVAKTAKRAVTPIKTPKDRIDNILSKNGNSSISDFKKKKRKNMTKMTASQKAYARSKRMGNTQRRVSNQQFKVRGA